MKEYLRKEMQKKRNDLNENVYKNLSLVIQKKTIDFLKTQTFNSIAIYSSINKEIKTDLIFDFFRKEKTVLFPFIKENKMFFSEINDLSQLKKGKYGIFTPPENAYKGNIDFIIVPGLVFNLSGYRIGYGGGFYDRFFSENNSPVKISMAFSFQITKEDISEKHDIPVNYIVTENNFYKM